MIELIGLVLVVSVLGMIISTLLKGAVRIVAFAVLAALAVSAIGEPITSRFPLLSDLFQNYAEVQPLPEGGAGGAGGAPDTQAFTDAPTSQSYGVQANSGSTTDTLTNGNAGGAGGTTSTSGTTGTAGTAGTAGTTGTGSVTSYPRPRTDRVGYGRTPVTGMW